jgi:putative tryptophan/tyrosine transport system substrate-binding protein
MNRRRFLLTSLIAVVTGPRAVQAQAGKTHRIGWLAPAPNPNNLGAFRNGLRSLGYVEGNNVVVEQRYAEEGNEHLDRAAAGLVRSSLDVIVTDGSAATVALKRAATTSPVVFVSGDPVAMGLVSSLSRPGGTMTGFAIISTELNVKRLELLRETIPQASRLGVLHEPRQRRDIIPPIAAGARSLGFELTRLEVRAAADFDGAFTTAVRERVAVVMPVASALFHAERHKLVNLAARHRMPTIYENRAFAEAGGLMSYGPDVADIFRRAATYVDRILTGTKPADLPVEQPTKFDLVINLKTAKALGLTIPPSLLARADQVIE